MNEEKNKTTKRKHDPFFRWLFAYVRHAKQLLLLAAKVNRDVDMFLSQVDINTLKRIPDSFSSVDDTGEADLAFHGNCGDEVCVQWRKTAQSAAAV